MRQKTMMTIISSLSMSSSFHVVKEVSVILFDLPFSNYNSLFLMLFDELRLTFLFSLLLLPLPEVTS